MAIIYRGTVSSFYKTNNLMNFYNNVVDGNKSGNSMYLVIGRKEPWAVNENDVGFAPPYPYDEPAGHADVWSRSLGFIKINESNTIAVYPRRDFGDQALGSNAYIYDIGDIICTNTSPTNSSPKADAGIMVYKVVDIPETGSCSIDNITTDSTDPESLKKETCIGLGGTWMPTPADSSADGIPTEKGMAVDNGDGYIYEYMYTIPPEIVVQHVTDEYIVVPFPSDVESDPEKYGLNTTLTDITTNRIIYNIKCNLLQFKIPLSIAQFPELADPAGDGFRQLTIVYNPILKKTQYDEPSIVAQGDFYKREDLTMNSGEVIYMENRSPIYKSRYQEELVTITFSY